MKVYRTRYLVSRCWYHDPFIEEITPVSYKSWKKYLKDTYDLTPQEVYNIVNGFDRNYKGRCKICGSDDIIWSIQRGYSPTCKSIECIGKHRSNLTSEMNRVNWTKSEYRERQSKVSSKILKEVILPKLWSDPEYRVKKSKLHSERMTRFNSDPKFFSKSHKGSFMRYGSESDRCYLYAGYTETRFKYGVTSKIKRRPYEVGILYPHTLVTSTRKYVADLEEYLNLNLGSEYIPVEKVSEFFKLLKNGVQRLGVPPYPEELGETLHSESRNSDEDIV